MKVFLKLLFFCFLIFECSAYSHSMNVGSGIWLKANMNNESSFTGQGFYTNLTFTYAGQDVLGVTTNRTGSDQYEVIFKFIQNVPVQIYLAVQQDTVNSVKLCQLNFFADKAGVATASEIDLQPSIVHCQFSGDPNQDNFTLTVQDNINKKRKSHA